VLEVLNLRSLCTLNFLHIKVVHAHAMKTCWKYWDAAPLVLNIGY